MRSHAPTKNYKILGLKLFEDSENASVLFEKIMRVKWNDGEQQQFGTTIIAVSY